MKSYCYKTKCKPTETGFNTLVIKVCKECKEELTDNLYASLKEREKLSYEEQERIAIQEENMRLSPRDDDDQTDFWGFSLMNSDFMGD